MENLEKSSCRTENSAGHDRVWAQIDMDAVLFNMESMRANIREDTKIVAVLKTNGYGHGAAAIMKELEKLPYVWGYAAATFEEAAELRENGAQKPIILLGYVFPYCYRDLARLAIRPACFREDMLEDLSEAAQKEGEPIRIHIALDTGMGRIGIRPDDAGLSFVRKALGTPGVIVEGMFTHFAKADEEDPVPTYRQIELYTGFRDRIREEAGYEIPLCHCSNSAGIIEFPQANMNLVRAGITLYGLWPSAQVSKTVVPRNEHKLRRNIHDKFGEDKDRHSACGIRRRISQKPFRQRVYPCMRQKSADPRQSVHGPDDGGHNRYSPGSGGQPVYPDRKRRGRNHLDGRRRRSVRKI